MSFKTKYEAAKTYGDLNRVIDDLSDNAIYEMIGSMKVVADTTGLDMKQEATLTMLQTIIQQRVRWDELTENEQAEQDAGC